MIFSFKHFLSKLIFDCGKNLNKNGKTLKAVLKTDFLDINY